MRKLYVVTWFERDRACVEVRDYWDDDNTVVEWWDDAVHQAVKDGYLNPRDWTGSALQYVKDFNL